MAVENQERKYHRVRYRIEIGNFETPCSEDDRKPVPGVRVLSSDPDCGYTDSICVASILRAEDGSIGSVLWLIDPNLSRAEAWGLVNALKHHLESHFTASEE